jgi:hypothetical protein
MNTPRSIFIILTKEEENERPNANHASRLGKGKRRRRRGQGRVDKSQYTKWQLYCHSTPLETNVNAYKDGKVR